MGIELPLLFVHFSGSFRLRIFNRSLLIFFLFISKFVLRFDLDMADK